MNTGMGRHLCRATVPLTTCSYGLFINLQQLLIYLAQVELATGRHTLH